MENMNISITGDLGSGKSAVAKALCARLGYQYFSTGSIQRELAKEKGLDTLQMNFLAETNHAIDQYIDDFLRDIDKNKTKHVLDSRLAWHFVPHSFKIYIRVLPEIAAQRVANDTQRTGEPEAHTLQEKAALLLKRQQAENLRFKTKYNVQCDAMQHYNLVVDSSYASVEEIADLIVTTVSLYHAQKPFHKFWVSPKILLPTSTSDTSKQLSIGKSSSFLFINSGHALIKDYLKKNERWVYFDELTKQTSAAVPSVITTWENELGFSFLHKPG